MYVRARVSTEARVHVDVKLKINDAGETRCSRNFSSRKADKQPTNEATDKRSRVRWAAFFSKMRMALQKIIKIKFSKYNVNSAIYLSIIKTLCIIGFRESCKIRSSHTKNLNISQKENVTKTAMHIRIQTNNEIRHWIMKFVL